MKGFNILLDKVSKWWLILVFIVGVIVMWTNLQGQVVANTKDIQTLNAQYQAVASNQNQIQVQLSQIQTDILWIKNTLSGSTVTVIK